MAGRRRHDIPQPRRAGSSRPSARLLPTVGVRASPLMSIVSAGSACDRQVASRTGRRRHLDDLASKLERAARDFERSQSAWCMETRTAARRRRDDIGQSLRAARPRVVVGRKRQSQRHRRGSRGNHRLTAYESCRLLSPLLNDRGSLPRNASSLENKRFSGRTRRRAMPRDLCGACSRRKLASA